MAFMRTPRHRNLVLMSPKLMAFMHTAKPTSLAKSLQGLRFVGFGAYTYMLVARKLPVLQKWASWALADWLLFCTGRR